MQIQIEGKPMTIPDGTLAVFVDPSGKLLWVGLADGEIFRDAMTQPLGSIDPTKDSHSEIELKTMNIPPSGSTLALQGIDALRVCRNQSGEVVRCPPR